MHKINKNIITCIGLNRYDDITIQEEIYYILFLKYPKISIYKIAYIISVYKKL